MVNKIGAIQIKGDDEVAIQRRVDEIILDYRKKNLNLIIIDADSVKNIENLAKNNTLFGNIGTYVIKGQVDPKIIKKYFFVEKEEKYEIPKIIYKFFDSIYPNNKKEITNKYILVLKTESHDKIFALLVRLYRDLIWAKIDTESLSYPEWRLNKLKYQSEKYSLDQLKKILRQLIEIDIKVKTGKGLLNELLDLFILGRLE